MSSDSEERRLHIASRRAVAADSRRRPTAKRDRSYSPFRANSNGYRDEEERDRRSSSRSPSRRRRASLSGRSRSRRRAPRSCRSRSRTRSEECEDRRCCRPRQAADRDADDEGYMSQDEEFLVRIDRDDDLFKCAECDHLLSSPVYECVEGHVTCAACHDSANGGDGDEECCRCSSTEYRRSRAVAGWLRSVRFSCRNYEYGCPAFRARHEMDAHDRSCRYAPCFCPVRRCDGFHGGPPDALERHLTARHGWTVVDIRYGQPSHVRVVHPTTRCVLRAEDGELFHLSAAWERGGTALSMICIRPENAAEAEFTYEVRTPAAAGMQHRLQMQSMVWCTSLRYERADANPVRVTVPDDMFPLDGPQRNSVEVRVHKVAPAAGARSN